MYGSQKKQKKDKLIRGTTALPCLALPYLALSWCSLLSFRVLQPFRSCLSFLSLFVVSSLPIFLKLSLSPSLSQIKVLGRDKGPRDQLYFVRGGYSFYSLGRRSSSLMSDGDVDMETYPATGDGGGMVASSSQLHQRLFDKGDDALGVVGQMTDNRTDLFLL
jgi:hypothetical protein